MGVIAAALITMGIPLGLAIEHTHHPPATSAPHQAGQKCASSARRFPRAVLLHLRVFQQQRLIVFILLPTDIAGMIVAQENIPFLPRLFEPANLAGATVHDPCLLSDSAKRIGASIERMVQYLHHRVIGRRLPAELVDLNVPQDHRHLNVRSAQPKKDLPGAAELAELREDESNHSRHMFATFICIMCSSISILPRSFQQNPVGSMTRSPPRLALESRAAIPRWRSGLSSYSDIVP